LDIAGWLRSLGLEQYEDAFRENAIDADVLRDLTADDLRELGVTHDDPHPHGVGFRITAPCAS
jgi:SAM domain (Sterile alpha motif)